MYVLTTISDLVQISPQDFEKHSIDAITDNLNLKYADKVIPGVGLCIGLNDILDSSEGMIGHGTGIVNVNVKFRLRVFRPAKGEVLEGTIKDYNETGIFISMEFFENIYIPAPTNLFEGSSFNVAQDVWIWTPQAPEDGPPSQPLSYDANEVVRFRVEGLAFHDQSPQNNPSEDAKKPPEETNAPFSIVGSMQEVGLGVVVWWLKDDDANGEGQELA